MRLGVAIQIMKMRRRVEDPSRTLRANGPPSKMVPQAANPNRMSAAVAVSRGPRGKTAHVGGSMGRNANSGALRFFPCHRKNASTPQAVGVAKTATQSRKLRKHDQP